jgi:hypothetical protein
MVNKKALGQVFSEYFNLHSTKFSIITITRGRYNRPVVADVPSGPNMDSTPPLCELNIIRKFFFKDPIIIQNWC